MKHRIYGYTLEELQEELTAKGIKPYKTKIIYRWLHTKTPDSWQDITSISKPEREMLEGNYLLSHYDFEKVESSGAIKYVLTYPDNETIECVVIKSRDRTTLCVSSQVGCALGCTFCATGNMGFKRNLTTEEIVFQYILASREGHKIDNVVYMGMGEPLLNLDNVLKSIAILNDPFGAQIGIRRFTVSTVGIIRGIETLIEKGIRLNLAVSIHQADEEKRSEIVPANKANPLFKLLDVVHRYMEESGRRVTLEYTLLQDINDKDSDAQELIFLVKGTGFHVNLIPYNAAEGKYKTSTRAQRFQKILLDRGINATLRRSEGSDINAACGMLAAKKSH